MRSTLGMGSFRTLCRGIACFLAVITVAHCCEAGEPSNPGPRYNIILFLADDMRWDALGCMGNPIIQTPHFDQLARQGVRFTHAFVTTSICAPSRASIFSGQYVRRHKIDDFQKSFSPEALQLTYPMLLKKAGYRVGFIGKWGVGTKLPAEDFDYWRGFPGQGTYFDSSGIHLTRRMGDQALEFLAQCPPEQHFCLSISFKAPHCEDSARAKKQREFPPDPQDEPLYKDVQVPLPKSYGDAFFRLLPSFVQESEARRRYLVRFANHEMYQATVKDYYRLITGMDREIGRVLEALRQRGWDRRTAIIFSSDNGFFLGEHGLAGKWFMYEESIRVPLIVSAPDVKPELRGRALNPMVLNIDLAPTILDYAQVPIPGTMQGRSLRAWLTDTPANWRRDFFYEHHTLPKILPPSEGVRTERYKYLRWLRHDAIVEELYDLQRDPHEIQNLAQQPKYQNLLQQLRQRYEELKRQAE
ncbi:Arylsulfatase [bacterium HR36]|nr:Arylsulfatase [bacterium HR36]